MASAPSARRCQTKRNTAGAERQCERTFLMTMSPLPQLFLACGLALTFGLGMAACDSSAEDSTEETSDSTTGEDMTFGTAEDLAMAATLWAAMEGHESWGSFEGLEGLQASGAPHGEFVEFYINDIAAGDTAGLPNGSIILKKNYGSEDTSSLGALTAMQKVDGYSPDAGDWFWVKYLPDGSVDVNPDGIPLAGRVGLGTDTACIGCHKSEADFVFVN